MKEERNLQGYMREKKSPNCKCSYFLRWLTAQSLFLLLILPTSGHFFKEYYMKPVCCKMLHATEKLQQGDQPFLAALLRNLCWYPTLSALLRCIINSLSLFLKKQSFAFYSSSSDDFPHLHCSSWLLNKFLGVIFFWLSRYSRVFTLPGFSNWKNPKTNRGGYQTSSCHL